MEQSSFIQNGRAYVSHVFVGKDSLDLPKHFYYTQSQSIPENINNIQFDSKLLKNNNIVTSSSIPTNINNIKEFSTNESNLFYLNNFKSKNETELLSFEFNTITEETEDISSINSSNISTNTSLFSTLQHTPNETPPMSSNVSSTITDVINNVNNVFGKCTGTDNFEVKQESGK